MSRCFLVISVVMTCPSARAIFLNLTTEGGGVPQNICPEASLSPLIHKPGPDDQAHESDKDEPTGCPLTISIQREWLNLIFQILISLSDLITLTIDDETDHFSQGLPNKTGDTSHLFHPQGHSILFDSKLEAIITQPIKKVH
jgi:hypothetical protein